MIDHVGETLGTIVGWSEGCLCHSEVPALQGPDRHSFGGLAARTGTSLCPLATRRAPECAAGGLSILLQRDCDVVDVSVILDPTTLQCSQPERDLLLLDWSRARRHMRFVFSIKLAHWEQLPHVLFGVAHHCQATARRCARRASVCSRTMATRLAIIGSLT